MQVATRTGIAVLAALIVSIAAKDQGCGGFLEGDNGKFAYSPTALERDQGENCVWLVRSYGATQIEITMNELVPAEENGTVILYPDGAPGEADANPITLNSQAIGSTTALPGSIAVLILPNSSSSLSFTWDSAVPDNLSRNDSVTIAGYIEVPQGLLAWTPARRQERLWWVIGAGIAAEDTHVEWETRVDFTDCDEDDPCTCLSFEAFELSSKGHLLEVEKVCGRSTSGMLQMRSRGPLVVAASANTTERGASKVELRWVEEQGSSTTTTTTSTTASPEPEQSIYFTTYGQGVSAFSLETNEGRKIVNSSASLSGITHDSVSDKLYWASYTGEIYRASNDGAVVETLLQTTEYGEMYDLAFDWIRGNVYIVTYDGYILACGDGSMTNFNCFTIFNDQRYASGITLDPNEGLMYWTKSVPGSIQRAGMDGSNPSTLVTRWGSPHALTIDFTSRRLYWTEVNIPRIQSSDLDGGDVQLVVQLSDDSFPYGIALVSHRIYWGSAGNDMLQSSTKDGQDIQTFSAEGIKHVTVVPAVDRPITRPNDCVGRNCTQLCVLTPTSYRCLA